MNDEGGTTERRVEHFSIRRDAGAPPRDDGAVRLALAPRVTRFSVLGGEGEVRIVDAEIARADQDGVGRCAKLAHAKVVGLAARHREGAFAKMRRERDLAVDARREVHEHARTLGHPRSLSSTAEWPSPRIPRPPADPS